MNAANVIPFGQPFGRRPSRAAPTSTPAATQRLADKLGQLSPSAVAILEDLVDRALSDERDGGSTSVLEAFADVLQLCRGAR